MMLLGKKMYIYKNVDVGRWVGMLESAEGDSETLI